MLFAVVGFKEFYSSRLPQEHDFSLLEKYPSDLLLLSLTKINSLLFNEGQDTRANQLAILTACFPNIGEQKRKQIASFIVQAREKNIAFFTAPVLSRLIASCLLHYVPRPDNDTIFDIGEFQEGVFDTILIYNNQYYDSHYPDKDLATYEAIWHLGLSQQGYMRSHSDLIGIAPLKTFFLYKFLMDILPSGNEYLREFCDHFGIPGYYNYLIFFIQIIEAIIQGDQIKHVVTPSSEQHQIITQFSIPQERLLDKRIKGNVHGELMTHPFYFITKETAAIIDPHYIRYVIDIGLPYQLYQHSSLNKSVAFPKFENFKAMLGKKYYEEYIIKGLLQKIFNTKNYSLFTTEDNSPLPDIAVVRNQKDILLIEVKSAAIHFNPLEDIDVDAFRKFVNDEFCNQKISPKQKNKGVYQLAKQIKDLAMTDKLDCLIKDKSKKKRLSLFPVLIYTDDVMDMSGINSYINEFFIKEIEPEKDIFKKIQPVVAINLSFFLRYYAELRQNSKLLFELIAGYNNKVAELNKSYKKAVGNPVLFLNKNLSFEVYAAGKMRGSNFLKSFQAITNDFHLHT